MTSTGASTRAGVTSSTHQLGHLMYWTTVLLLLVLGCANANLHGDLENTEVSRVIDLKSQFAKHYVNVTVSNVGSSAVQAYDVAVLGDMNDHLAHFTAQSKGVTLKTTVGSKISDDYQLYRVQLAESLPTNGKVELQLYFVFTHTMSPFPAAISQMERQYVRYYDNHFFFSPYKTKSQKTEVKLPSAMVESKSEQAPTSQKGDTITYGPYADIAPFSKSQMSLHFENNSPFITVTKASKLVEISHWGNVAVEEEFELRHDGAKLKGTFSRYDYQRTRGHAPAHIPTLTQILPVDATDFYYRDEIGNISTSMVEYTDENVILQLAPRFPLFGGWRFGYYMGYNLPLSSYVFWDYEDSGKYMLNITFGTDLQNAVIDDYTVRVILPEGAKDATVHVPFAIDGQSTDTHYTYLDTAGRPVLIINKKNVVSDHEQYFQVTYYFNRISMLNEPLLLIISFFTFFVLIMVYVRLEFSIGPKSTVRLEVAEKVEGYLLRFRDIMEQRARYHTNLDSALNKALSSKNIQQYQTERHRIDIGLDNCKKEMAKIVQEVQEISGDVGKKLALVEEWEEKKTLNQSQLRGLEIDYLKNPSLKGTYEESRGKFEKGFAAACKEIESLVFELTENL